MKRRNVYLGMTAIVLITIGITFFLNQARGIPVMPALTDLNQIPNHSGFLYGDFNNPLAKPMDVTNNGQFIYVTDPENHQIKMIDNGGIVIHTFGERGLEPGQLQFPYGIDFDNNNNKLYVADLYTGKISMFSDRGEFLGYFAEDLTENFTIDGPGGLRIVDEKLYLTDINSNQILVFNLEEELLLTFGETGTDAGQLIAPNAIAVDSAGNMYVSDTGNSRIQVFDQDGEFVRIITGTGNDGDPIFVNPRGIAIDASNRLFVVDNMTHNVHSMDLEGNPLFTFGRMGQGTNEFFLPNGLFIDNRNTIMLQIRLINELPCIVKLLL
ncbi:MAG: 6-bladed beta-propeller [Bacillus sp. (in: Bacteria)]|nr:6-bladed beta-propeller [Bacillus sp. (in: firmicutes)]